MDRRLIRDRLSPALVLAVGASVAWLWYMVLQGARLEEIREVAGYLAGITVIWWICRHDAELVRLAGVLAAVGFVYLMLV